MPRFFYDIDTLITLGALHRVGDRWNGLDAFLQPGTEILLTDTSSEMLAHLAWLTPERRAAIGGAARKRVLSAHTFAHRAAQFEAAYQRVLSTPGGIRDDRGDGPPVVSAGEPINTGSRGPPGGL